MAVEVHESSGRLEVSLPKKLFGGLLSSPTENFYAAARDGQRFLVVAPLQGGMRIHVVTDWPELLGQQ